MVAMMRGRRPLTKEPISGGWRKHARTIACVTGSIALVTCAQLAGGEDAPVLGMRPSRQVWDVPERITSDRHDQDAAVRFAAAVSRRP